MYMYCACNFEVVMLLSVPGSNFLCMEIKASENCMKLVVMKYLHRTSYVEV